MPDGDHIGATRALADAVRELRYDDLPDEAREVARHCLLDFLGCALAGSREPLTDILRREIVEHERLAEAVLHAEDVAGVPHLLSRTLPA